MTNDNPTTTNNEFPDEIVDRKRSSAGLLTLIAGATATPGRMPADKKAQREKAATTAAARSFGFVFGRVNDVPDPDVCEETSTYATTNLGLGERTERHFARYIVWCPEISSWIVWDGQRWVLDSEGIYVNAAIFATMRSITVHEAALAERKSEAVIKAARELKVAEEGGLATADYKKKLDEAKAMARKEIETYGRRCEDTQQAQSRAISHLKTKVSKPMSIFDTHLLKVNSPSGTYHVGTRELYESRPEDYITRMCTTDIVPGALMTDDVQKMIDHVERQYEGASTTMLRTSGTFLTGITDTKSIQTNTGPSNSAKSTWYEVLFHVTGGVADYAYGAIISPNALDIASTRNGSGHQDAIDTLASRTWVFLDECQDSYLDTEKLKGLCAGAPQTTSAKGKKSRTWISKLGVAMAANGPFKFPANDDAFLQRLLPMDFAVPIPENEKDPQLKHRLKREQANQEAFLWAVLNAGSDWYEEYQELLDGGDNDSARNALKLPSDMSEIRTAFGAAGNPLTAFLDDVAIVGDEAELQKKYGQYGKADTATWLAYYNSRANRHYGRKQMSDDKFGQLLTQLGYTAGNATDVTYEEVGGSQDRKFQMKGKRVRLGIRFSIENDWWDFSQRYVSYGDAKLRDVSQREVSQQAS